MATYTPPDGDDVDFSFAGSYTPPAGDSTHFLFGTVAVITIGNISRELVYNDTGFRTSIVRWSSDIDGEYRIEIGGTGVNTGALIASGNVIGSYEMETAVDYTDITTASGYAGEGDYQFNVYVKGSDDIWTPYNYSG